MTQIEVAASIYEIAFMPVKGKLVLAVALPGQDPVKGSIGEVDLPKVMGHFQLGLISHIDAFAKRFALGGPVEMFNYIRRHIDDIAHIGYCEEEDAVETVVITAAESVVAAAANAVAEVAETVAETVVGVAKSAARRLERLVDKLVEVLALGSPAASGVQGGVSGVIGKTQRPGWTVSVMTPRELRDAIAARSGSMAGACLT